MNAPHQKSSAPGATGPGPLSGVQPLERRRLQAYLALVIADVVLILLSFALAGLIYLDTLFETRTMLAAQLILPLYLTIGFYNGTYSLVTLTDAQTAIFRLVTALLISAALLNFFAFYAKSNAVFSRVAFTLGLTLAAVSMAAARLAAIRIVRWVIGPTPQNVLVIEDGGAHVPVEHAYRLNSADYGIKPDITDPHGLDRLGRIMRHMDRVIVSCEPAKRAEWALVLKGSGVQGELLSDVAHAIGALGIRHSPELGFTSLIVSTGPLGIRARTTKRAFDMALSAAALILLLPLFLIIAIAIKLADGGPVLFVQQRVGRANQLFSIYKFRTMKVVDQDHEGQSSAMPDDKRLTAIGGFLRRTSLDELPQLFNVLTGSMSLVGPRPHALGSQAGKKLFWEVDSRYWHRHALRPGMTGLAQIRGLRGATDREDELSGRLQADLEYISRWSVWMDIGILIATLRVLTHAKAY